MRVSRLAYRALVLAFAALALAQMGLAQCSVTNKGLFFDAYVPGGDNRECNGCPRMFNQVIAHFNQRPTLFTQIGDELVAYDAASPAFGLGLIFQHVQLWSGVRVHPHHEYRFENIAVLDDFPYGIASFSSDGWVLFQTTWDATGKVTMLTRIGQFTFPSFRDLDRWMYNVELFRQPNGHVYAVGRYLGPTGSADLPYDLRIVDMGDGTSTPPMTLVGTLPATTGSSVMKIVQTSTDTYLYLFGSTLSYPSGALFIYKLTTPSAPQLVNTIDGRTMPAVAFQLSYGMGYTDLVAYSNLGGNRRLYTSPFIPDGNYTAYILDLTDPTSPQQVGSVTVPGGALNGIDSDGQFLAVHHHRIDGEPRVSYFSVVGDTFSAIPGGAIWDPNDAVRLYENTHDLAITQVGSDYRVFRAYQMRAYWDTVSVGCVSTTPSANLGVTRATDTGPTSCSGGTHTIDAKGFPGDAFTVTNLSTGSFTVISLVAKGIDASTGNTAYSQTLTGTGPWSWTSPGAYTGEFELTLTVRGDDNVDYTASKYVYLCGNPVASLKVTKVNQVACNPSPCTSWLFGDTLTLSAAGSQGNPDFANTHWGLRFRAPGADWMPLDIAPTGSTYDLNLGQLGDYEATVNVAYPFNQYTSVAGPQVFHSGQVTASLSVLQGGTPIARNGLILASSAFDLKWVGALATGQTATCQWRLLQDGQTEVWSQTDSPCLAGAVKTHPGLAAGNYTATLLVTTSGQDSASDTFPFLVSNCSPPGAAASPNPPDGASGYAPGQQTLSWSTPTVGSGPFTYTVYGPIGPYQGCDGISATSCTTGNSYTSGAFKWKVKVSNACGSYTPDAFWEYTIGTPCTAPSAPSPVSPADGASVAAGAVTFSWTAASGTSPITYAVSLMVNGVGIGGCSSSTTSCSATIGTAGTYSWKVTASNSCGSAASTTRTLVVTGTQPPPNADFTFTPTTPNIGQDVTFTVTNAGGYTKVRWNFGQTGCDGAAAIQEKVCLNTPCEPWLSATFPFATAGGKTVTLEGWNTSTSAWVLAKTRTLTVNNQGTCTSCIAPTVPTPTTPASGATVQPGAITFTWGASTGTTPINYSVGLTAGTIGVGSCSSSGTSCTATLNAPGNYTWKVTASNSCGNNTSNTVPFTVQDTCTAPGAAGSPSPANNASVSGTSVTLQWAAPSTGSAPFTYDVYVDELKKGEVSTATYVASGLTSGVHTWKVVAKNRCGQTATPAVWSFNLCNASQQPVANFDWSPKGQDPYFPAQQQPFEGQEVTFTDTSTGSPSAWEWRDFNQNPPFVYTGGPIVKYTWSSVSGDSQKMNVRLKVTNCAGNSSVTKQVTVYKDVRPVLARFSVSASPTAGSPVTFTAENGPAEGQPTHFMWDFGDGTEATTDTAETTHTYACGRVYTVVLTTKRGSTTSAPATKGIVVGGRACAPDALVVPDVAVNLESPYALWQSKVRLYNPTAQALPVDISARTKGGTTYTGSLTIPAGAASSLDDIVAHLDPPLANEVVTIWFKSLDGGRLPVVGARTFTAPPGGGTYGQAVPVYYVWPSPEQPITLWVEGSEHDGTKVAGFRSNLTIVNPTDQSWGGKEITLTLISATGDTYTATVRGLGAQAYRRWNPITELFGLDPETPLGAFTLRVDVPTGIQALVGCSVNDNQTNDSFFILGQADSD